MSRNRKPLRRSRKTRTRSFDWTRARRVIIPTSAAVLVLALGMGMTVGVNQLDHSARRILARHPVTIELNRPVRSDGIEWVPRDEYDALVLQAQRMIEQADPFDPAVLRAVASTLESSGWFRSIRSVKRTGRSSVRIEADWRSPAAVIRHAGRDRLISWEAMPLPMEFPIGASGAVAIIGAGLSPANPRTLYAHPWPGDDVRAALDLLRLLVREPFIDQVAAIDISGLARDKPIVIYTDHETRVVWGAAPNTFRPGEVSDEIKLKRLRELFERYGRIDAGSELVEIHAHVPLRLPADSEP